MAAPGLPERCAGAALSVLAVGLCALPIYGQFCPQKVRRGREYSEHSVGANAVGRVQTETAAVQTNWLTASRATPTNATLTRTRWMDLCADLHMRNAKHAAASI